MQMIRDESFRRRIRLVSIVLVGISAILLARLLSFQFRMNPEVRAQIEENAESRYSRTVEIMPNRGQIYDRSGNLLAVNSYEYRIGISPNADTDRQALARNLAPLVGMTEDEIYHKTAPDENGIYPSYVLLAPVVDFATGQKIAEMDINGMQVEPLPTRIYPQGALTAQLVGFFAGADETRHRRGYWGVEGWYESLLAGQSKNVDVRTIPILEEPGTANVRVRDGIDLELTIDRDVQQLAQEVLDQAVAEQNATGGSIVIMNPRTGEILAIANNPTFIPGDMSVENLELAKNQAVANVYEPGSVFKVVTMAMALEVGIDPNTWTYYDPGCWAVPGAAITVCNWDSASRGNPSFAQVFIESLNTGTTALYKEMATRLGGPYQIYDMLRDFGVGSETGVDIEGESPGILVEPGDPNWSEAQFLTTSFGQGVSVTPLQMLTFVNAIANDGLIMQPHIVRAQIDGDKRIEMRPSASHRPISEQTAHTARDIMVQVLQQSREIEFELPGYTVAGKTGTAQIPAPYGYEAGTIASFVGFLPADDPVVSVLVKLDRPAGYWGSKTAAPTFQKLVERLVVLMEIPPDQQRYQLIAQGGDPFQREY